MRWSWGWSGLRLASSMSSGRMPTRDLLAEVLLHAGWRCSTLGGHGHRLAAELRAAPPSGALSAPS